MKKVKVECLGSAIKSTREKLEMTQRELADKLHITPRYLQDIEHGKKNPSYKVFVRLLQELDISADMIFHYNQDDKRYAVKIIPH